MAAASIPGEPASIPLRAALRFGPCRRLVERLGLWSVQRPLDARTRYLSQASDCVDLEARLRNWDRHEQQQARLNLML